MTTNLFILLVFSMLSFGAVVATPIDEVEIVVDGAPNSANGAETDTKTERTSEIETQNGAAKPEVPALEPEISRSAATVPSPSPSPLTSPPPTAIEVAREVLPMDMSREEAASKEADKRYAEVANRYLQGKLGSIEKSTLKRDCAGRGNSNPFCSLIRQSRTLDRYLNDKNIVRQPYITPPPEPVLVEWKGNKVSNWKKLRTTKIPALLKGLNGKTVPELINIGEAALVERKCPVPLAVAVAATLEDHLPQAELYQNIARLYEKGGDCSRREPVDQEHFLTRAGLFYLLAKDYPAAERALRRVNPNDAFSGRSIFWLARVRAKMGNTAGAEKAKNALLRRHPFSFHSLVTAFESKSDPAAKYLASKPIAAGNTPRSKPVAETVKQIQLLRRYGYNSSGELVAGWALSRTWRMSASERLFLASLADANTQVTTLPWLLIRRPDLISRESMELWYPSSYLKLIEKHGNGADPFLLLAIAKKESAFDSNAISIARAQGLMQLNPDTAAKIDPDSVTKLLEPAINIEMGSRHVNDLLKRFNGNIALVIAAYNAGEDPVLRWKTRYPSDEPILFLDLIPYRETRDYVGYVLSNYYWYRRLYMQTAPPDMNGFWAREPSNTVEPTETSIVPVKEP